MIYRMDGICMNSGQKCEKCMWYNAYICMHACDIREAYNGPQGLGILGDHCIVFNSHTEHNITIGHNLMNVLGNCEMKHKRFHKSKRIKSQC